MELFEVSAKDNTGEFGSVVKAWTTDLVFAGIQSLFDHLITAIIQRKDRIERENELKKRDSVMLSAVPTPAWSAQADEEEAREKAELQTKGWSCC